MKTLIIILCTGMTMSLFGQNAETIISKYVDANRVEFLSGRITYKNISRSGRVQERTLDQFIRKNNPNDDAYSFLLKFVAPGDVAGTATLTIQHAADDDDQWLYLPVVRAARKISASKKSDRFMGTEMTYEDLSLYLTEKTNQWTYTLEGTEMKSGASCYKIIAEPNNMNESQYSKRILWISKEKSVLVEAAFYDNKSRLLKTFTAYDIRAIGSNQYRAHKVVLKNIITGNSTEVYYSGFDLSKTLTASLFTKAQLETL